ncbi:hypothetical protein DsansV1_C23g0174111 [Dioscorea sansibarensis]
MCLLVIGVSKPVSLSRSLHLVSIGDSSPSRPTSLSSSWSKGRDLSIHHHYIHSFKMAPKRARHSEFANSPGPQDDISR